MREDHSAIPQDGLGGDGLPSGGGDGESKRAHGDLLCHDHTGTKIILPLLIAITSMVTEIYWNSNNLEKIVH